MSGFIGPLRQRTPKKAATTVPPRPGVSWSYSTNPCFGPEVEYLDGDDDGAHGGGGGVSKARLSRRERPQCVLGGGKEGAGYGCRDSDRDLSRQRQRGKRVVARKRRQASLPPSVQRGAERRHGPADRSCERSSGLGQPSAPLTLCCNPPLKKNESGCCGSRGARSEEQRSGDHMQ